MVGGTGGKVTDVGRKEYTRDIGGVGLKGGDRNEAGDVSLLNESPDVDISLSWYQYGPQKFEATTHVVVSCTE